MRLIWKTLIAACLAVASTPIALAQQPESFDDTKFCIYNNGLYSLGAMIEVGDVMLECRYVPATSEGVSAGAQWVRL